MMKNETAQIAQELRARIPELFQSMDDFDEEVLRLNIDEMLRWKQGDAMTIIPGNVFYTPVNLTDEQYEQFLLFESLFVDYIGAQYTDTSKTYVDIFAEIEKICEEKNVSWEEANEIYFGLE